MDVMGLSSTGLNEICSRELPPHVADKTTTKAMWDSWKALHVTNQQKINIHYYFKDLYTQKYADGTSMANHIAIMLDIENKIMAAGKELPDIHVTCILVLSLPCTLS